MLNTTEKNQPQSAEKPVKRDQSVELRFMGQKFVLKSQGDPDTIKEVVDLATLRLTDVERRAKGAAAHQVALLALLDLAKEYVKAKRRSQEHKKKIEKRTSELRRALGTPLK